MNHPNKFSDLNLLPAIQQALEESNYLIPTPIQAQAIPYLLEGRDLLGCAQTGTGKTAAFALPILHRLVQSNTAPRPKHARVLVLTPTRELAIQVFDSFKAYGKHLDLKYSVVYGGVSLSPQIRDVSRGVDVLVATPGRLLDLIRQNCINLSTLEVLVLDEADRMLDMGFIKDIRDVLRLIPKDRHNLFFSATMPAEIIKLSASMLVNPVRIEVTPPATTVEKIDQYLMYVERDKKKDLLRFVLNEKTTTRVIVFTRTKHGANKVSEVLEKSGILSDAIHGNKSQGARQRALENFRSGKIRVLVATDIAARGIDVDDISHVINFELPNIAESYVHRIGRTARAGGTGVALSFCDSEEKAFLKDIEKLIGKALPIVTNHPYHSESVAFAHALPKGKAKSIIDGRGQARGASRRGARPANRAPKKAAGSISRPVKRSPK